MLVSVHPTVLVQAAARWSAVAETVAAAGRSVRGAADGAGLGAEAEPLVRAVLAVAEASARLAAALPVVAENYRAADTLTVSCSGGPGWPGRSGWPG